MLVKIDIKRYEPRTGKSFWQSFETEGSGNDTAADLLRRLNERKHLTDIEGREAEPVEWECGCMQKKCGGCAMIINGVPQLACSAFVKDLCRKKAVIKLEPLSKFPVVKDLRVDRSVVYENLQKMKVWMSGQAQYKAKEWEAEYTSASCLMCGCCLEICPNYTEDNSFTGAAVMNAAYRVASQQPAGKNRRAFIKENIKAGQGHCSKTLTCENVCPMKIPTGSLMSRMNRLFILDLLKRGYRHRLL